MSTSISETCGDAMLLLQTPPEWSVIGFNFSIRNTDSELTVMCNGKRFVLRLFADNLSESPKLRECYLFFLRVAEEFELDSFTVEDLWDWATEPLFPLFRELPHLDKTRQSTLDGFFNPETIVYTLRAKVVGPPNHTPRKVLLNDDTVAFLKLMHRGDKQFLKTELDTYKKIDKARLDSTTRVSRLHGLPETPTALREKWAAQLRDIITQLHNAGIVWGDAKPDNVLIDSNQDAWIVDFGGGYTEGWVPKTLAGTVEGDTVALEKMIEFIST
ncbi:hypothetical protein LCI18_002367 [Fusarium solani-melongenae]|uniref:Uncharacterized protein n=1 Tax=Fusarium solani subsp. cucurbitae TaxID=2747967 RepID=A0ACD3YR83_FUSSC|nr:hypothetical protein LCI18_002367 [Fusarium solani-melongenae]